MLVFFMNPDGRPCQIQDQILQSVAAGVVLQLACSAGLAPPMLLRGHGARALRQRVRAVAAHPLAVRWASGFLLVAFGVVILMKGMHFPGM
jgi:cytochrome c biogenesis protein CcdA